MKPPPETDSCIVAWMTFQLHHGHGHYSETVDISLTRRYFSHTSHSTILRLFTTTSALPTTRCISPPPQSKHFALTKAFPLTHPPSTPASTMAEPRVSLANSAMPPGASPKSRSCSSPPSPLRGTMQSRFATLFHSPLPTSRPISWSQAP